MISPYIEPESTLINMTYIDVNFNILFQFNRMVSYASRL